MRKYSKVHSVIWQDKKIRDLEDKTRTIFFYLLTSPHTNMIGWYYLNINYAAADLGYPIDRVSKGLNELENKALITYSEGSNMVVVHNFLKYNPVKGEKQAIGAINTINSLADKELLEVFVSCVVRHKNDNKKLCNLLFEEFSNELKDREKYPLDRVLEGYREGIDTDTDTNTDTNTDTELDKYADSIKEVHAHWINLLSDINEPGLTKNQKETILTKIKKWNKDKLKKAITNYNEVYRSDYYYSHNFTMFKFIQQGNGAPRFLPGLDSKYDGDIWKDYLQNSDTKKNNDKSEMLKELYAEAQEEDEQGEGEVEVL